MQSLIHGSRWGAYGRRDSSQVGTGGRTLSQLGLRLFPSGRRLFCFDELAQLLAQHLAARRHGHDIEHAHAAAQILLRRRLGLDKVDDLLRRRIGIAARRDLDCGERVRRGEMRL